MQHQSIAFSNHHFGSFLSVTDADSEKFAHQVYLLKNLQDLNYHDMADLPQEGGSHDNGARVAYGRNEGHNKYTEMHHQTIAFSIRHIGIFRVSPTRTKKKP